MRAATVGALRRRPLARPPAWSPIAGVTLPRGSPSSASAGNCARRAGSEAAAAPASRIWRRDPWVAAVCALAEARTLRATRTAGLGLLKPQERPGCCCWDLVRAFILISVTQRCGTATLAVYTVDKQQCMRAAWMQEMAAAVLTRCGACEVDHRTHARPARGEGQLNRAYLETPTLGASRRHAHSLLPVL